MAAGRVSGSQRATAVDELPPRQRLEDHRGGAALWREPDSVYSTDRGPGLHGVAKGRRNLENPSPCKCSSSPETEWLSLAPATIMHAGRQAGILVHAIREGLGGARIFPGATIVRALTPCVPCSARWQERPGDKTLLKRTQKIRKPLEANQSINDAFPMPIQWARVENASLFV